jgi:hypothetical protein
MLKVIGLKIMGSGWSITFGVKRLVRWGKASRNIHFGKEFPQKGFKLALYVGRGVFRHVLFQGFHFGIYGGMHGVIDGGNIGIDFSQFLLGCGDIKWQGIEVCFKVLIAGMVHGERGTQEGGRWVRIENGLREKGIMMIRAKMGIQWDRSQIRGLRGGRDHRKKKDEKW